MPATGPQALIATGTPILRQGTAEHHPNNPVSSIPLSQTATSLTRTKVAHFPLVWVNRNPSQSIRNDLRCGFWLQGPCCHHRWQQHQMKDTDYCLSLSCSRPSSIRHTPVAACWHAGSFKYAFISHTGLSTQQTILPYNPASHSTDCFCPLQKYLSSQVPLCC